MAKVKLTNKQILFCKEYIIDFNATRAAIAAGYSKKTATVIGGENLAKPYIQEYLSYAMKKRAEKTEVTAEKVVLELAKIGFSNQHDLEGYDECALKDKIKALELLAKHTGAFNKDESSATNVHIDVSKWLD